MFYSKYKLGRNHGLNITRISQSLKKSMANNRKPLASHSVNSFALLPNKEDIGNDKDYELHRLGPKQQQNTVIFFNEKEYLQRRFKGVFEHDYEQKYEQFNQQIEYNNHSLTIFIANESSAVNSVPNTNSKELSLLKVAYRRMIANKKQTSSIILSIVGIENQNSLVDELNFQWIEAGKIYPGCDRQPIRGIIKEKPRLKIIKDISNKFIAEGLTKQEISSQSQLTSILYHYLQIKNYVQYWFKYNQNEKDCMRGQLYQLSQVEYDPDYGTISNTISNHSILRVNQYLKNTSSLMLRLGIQLKNRVKEQRYQTKNLKPIRKLSEMHQSKILLLLSDCFRGISKSKYQKVYRIDIFNQIGQYCSLRDEYLNLAIFCNLDQDNGDDQAHQHSKDYIYLKHYLENRQIVNIVVSKAQKFMLKMQSIRHNSLNICKNREAIDQIYREGERVKSKSYYCDTISSIEKRLVKQFVQGQILNENQSQNLEQLIEETAKLYRLGSQVNRIKNLKQLKKEKLKMQHEYALHETKVFESIKKQNKTAFERSRPVTSNQMVVASGPKDKNSEEYIAEIYGKPTPRIQSKAKKNDNEAKASRIKVFSDEQSDTIKVVEGMN